MTSVRTIIDLPDDQLTALEAICRRDGISRAEAIRRAVADHVRHQDPGGRRQAFGLWTGRRVTGLAYERRLRGEWDAEAPRKRKRQARRS